MNIQSLHLLRVLLNPRITATPVRVLRELRRAGKRRLPADVEADLERGVPTKRLLGFLRHWLDGELLSHHGRRWGLNSFLPPFPSAAFDRMFENLLSGRRLSPVSAFLAVTARCPYDCWHCSLRRRPSAYLGTDQWTAIIDGLHQLGASLVGVTGGEPCMRADLPELVRRITDGGAEAIVFTSGAGFTPQLAGDLRAAGLWGVCVSFDHSDPHECDRLRGRSGAHDQAVAALRLARDAGFYTLAGAVATRRFVDQREYLKVYERAATLGVHEFRIVEPMPCGRLRGAAEDALLTPDHVRQLRKFHTETNRRGELPKVCAFNQIESPEIFGCGAGTQHLFIDAAGEVCPCDFTPLSFGNAARESLSSIWTRMTAAMGNPRRECFIQRHHAAIARYAEQGYPLPPETSVELCRELGEEPLPDYFALVTGGGRGPADDTAGAASTNDHLETP